MRAVEPFTEEIRFVLRLIVEDFLEWFEVGVWSLSMLEWTEFESLFLTALPKLWLEALANVFKLGVLFWNDVLKPFWPVLGYI